MNLSILSTIVLHHHSYVYDHAEIRKLSGYNLKVINGLIDEFGRPSRNSITKDLHYVLFLPRDISLLHFIPFGARDLDYVLFPAPRTSLDAIAL